jgi:4-hydroxybenzoyl-CoA thioesterase
MHILATVRSSDPTGAQTVQTSQCPIIFVAVDDTGTPVEVPSWTPVTMLDLQRHRQARVRISMRTRIDGAMDAQNYTVAGTAPRATVRVHVDTTDANRHGSVPAGRVMRWIDDAAYVCGADWTDAQVITSYVAGLRFYRPIVVGEVIDATARLIHTGPRSVHISIEVTTTHGGEPQLLAQGLVVVVSLDERGAARPVPRWSPATHEDRRLALHARNLIGLRQFIEPFTTVFADTEPARLHHNIAS